MVFIALIVIYIEAVYRQNALVL